ncbi:uncharacterized protein TNCV_3251361 [Trichonephila clavipes]|nr:uncharacterized protein TNCV_3251361 [Trichonephila clavipes]
MAFLVSQHTLGRCPVTTFPQRPSGKERSCSWRKERTNGRFKIVDEDRSGRPVLIATQLSEQQVDELIRADRRVTIDSIVTAIGCARSLAYNIIHDCSNFRKVHTRWVTRQLTEEHKKNRMGISFHLFSPQRQYLGGKQFADGNEV